MLDPASWGIVTFAIGAVALLFGVFIGLAVSWALVGRAQGENPVLAGVSELVTNPEGILSVGDDPEGLFPKYRVSKADGSDVDAAAEYLVLRLDSDPTCRTAALAWADELEGDGRHELAEDIRDHVQRLDGRPPA